MDFMNTFRARWARLASIALVAIGVLALVLGYIGVSGSAYTAEQLPYIASGAVGGIFLLGVAATLFLSADIYDEWKKLDLIEQHLAEGQEPARTPDPDGRPLEGPITAPMSAVPAPPANHRAAAGRS